MNLDISLIEPVFIFFVHDCGNELSEVEAVEVDLFLGLGAVDLDLLVIALSGVDTLHADNLEDLDKLLLAEVHAKGLTNHDELVLKD